MRAMTFGAIVVLGAGVVGTILFIQHGMTGGGIGFGAGFLVLSLLMYLGGRGEDRIRTNMQALMDNAQRAIDGPQMSDPVSGIATIVQFKEVGERVRINTKRFIMLDFVLDVAVEGRPPFRVDPFRAAYPDIRLGMLRPGERIPVRVDRADLTKLAFDWDAPPPAPPAPTA